VEKILNILENKEFSQSEKLPETTKYVSNTTNNLASSIHAPPMANKEIPSDIQPSDNKKKSQCSECEVLQNRIFELEKQMALILEKLKTEQNQTRPIENSTMDLDPIQTSPNDV
jgi:hypothetical protein